MSRIEGTTVLITGGASGLGRRLGERLLEAGAERLVIWDVDEGALETADTELTGAGHRVTCEFVDVSSPDAVELGAAALRRRGIRVGLLVNNAGVVVGKPFSAHTATDIERTMRVNALAPMHTTRELLPDLREGGGHVVNIASAAGLVSNPGMSVYCASKWAMVGWSDSLRLELEREDAGVGVTTVAPYYIDTGMFAGVRSPVLPILPVDAVARRIVRAVERNRVFLPLPRIVGLVSLLRGLLPIRWFDVVVGRWLGVYESMRSFRGRDR
ncbi:MAG: SDR family oxidoreductase [Gemmatimonadales bacterium]|jgi:short-subunit dehydrogenase